MSKKLEQLLRLVADMQKFQDMGNVKFMETDELSEDALILVAAAGDSACGEELFKKGFQTEIEL